MTAPVPSVPSWQSVPSSAVAPSAKAKPNDIWGLGQAYGQPVLLGVDVTHSTAYNEQVPGFTGQKGYGTFNGDRLTDVTKQTQQLMDKVAQQWASNPEGYAQLQAQLAAAGYYGSKGVYTPGRFDTETQAALKKVLTDYVHATRSAQGTPYTLDEFIGQQAQATQAAKAAQVAAKPPRQVSLTDPATIRAAAQQAFQASLGRSATDAELSAFVDQFQGAQQSSQLSTDAQVTSPDLGSDAQAFAQQGNTGEYKQHQVDAYTNSLMNLFLPAQSSRVNMAPVAPA